MANNLPIGRVFYHEQHGHVKVVEFDNAADKCVVVKVEADESFPPNRTHVNYSDLLDPQFLNG